MAKLVVQVLNLITVVGGLILASLFVVGLGFAINDGQIADRLPQKPIPTWALLECAAIPLGLIALFVVPSALLARRGRLVWAVSTAMLPVLPLIFGLSFLVWHMR